MQEILKSFWDWAGLTAEAYAKNGLGIQNEKVEFFYPQFEQMLKYAYEILQKETLSIEEIEDILTILALDNEGERILDYLNEHVDIKTIQQIVEVGLNHLQPNARWQLAELLYRRKPQNYKEYLVQLVNDDNQYVQKRAKNVMQYLNKDNL